MATGAMATGAMAAGAIFSTCDAVASDRMTCSPMPPITSVMIAANTMCSLCLFMEPSLSVDVFGSGRSGQPGSGAPCVSCVIGESAQHGELRRRGAEHDLAQHAGAERERSQNGN